MSGGKSHVRCFLDSNEAEKAIISQQKQKEDRHGNEWTVCQHFSGHKDSSKTSTELALSALIEGHRS